MTQPSSLLLDLGQQCTGVTPAPTIASPRLPTSGVAEEALKQRQSQVASDSREPLHDNNSQPSLGGSSSQKRSHTTSQSLAITPSEKRQTMLALSPARPLPPGLTTLEVERVLSLTPGNKPNFRRSPLQQGSQGSTHDGPAAVSRTSYCLESTPATVSPASHKQSGNTRQQTASPQSRPCNQDAPHVMHETCPATEPQLADFPATQLVCAATALDLMQTTQVVTADAAVCQLLCNAQHMLHPPFEPALGVKHAEGLEPTPMLHIAAVQDTEALSHERAPAGPVASPSQQQDSTHSKELAQAATSPTPMAPLASGADDNKTAAGNPHLLSSGISPANTAAADQMLPQSQPEPRMGSAKPGLYHRPARQQHSQLQQRRKSEPAEALHPGTAPSLDPSSLATGMDTANATLSQVRVCSCLPLPVPRFLAVLLVLLAGGQAVLQEVAAACCIPCFIVIETAMWEDVSCSSFCCLSGLPA